MDQAALVGFQTVVWEYYRQHGRDLPWRQPEADGSFDSYKILVSELMLQQTQVNRVIPKYQAFIVRFPSFADLAQAPLGDVLRLWSGLGYNRRAKFLWQTAKQVVAMPGGRLPLTSAELTRLPGIGPNTAGAILAYAFNKPVVFIETNIRTVFIHHFFAGQQDISDRQISDLVAATLPDDARRWYWALMDYGSYLKQTVGNLSKLSKHYVKQSAFRGSRRQIRGHILRLLGQETQTLASLQKAMKDERVTGVLNDLVAEGLVEETPTAYRLHQT
jgi:A/G-specific adenine glycosylase